MLYHLVVEVYLSMDLNKKWLTSYACQDIDHKTDYHSFKRKWGGDPRFEAIDRKERELLLNEKYVQLLLESKLLYILGFCFFFLFYNQLVWEYIFDLICLFAEEWKLLMKRCEHYAWLQQLALSLCYVIIEILRQAADGPG